MTFKVLLDTNVLISASVVAASTDLSVRINHPFSEISSDLLDYFHKNLRKRIGIVTQFIEDEVYYNMSKAVQSEIETNDLEDKAIDFEIFSAILNTCDNRLKKYLGILRREPVDETSVNINKKLIEAMYDELIQNARARERETRELFRYCHEIACKFDVASFPQSLQST